jgi:hypothetical protein
LEPEPPEDAFFNWCRNRNTGSNGSGSDFVCQRQPLLKGNMIFNDKKLKMLVSNSVNFQIFVSYSVGSKAGAATYFYTEPEQLRIEAAEVNP